MKNALVKLNFNHVFAFVLQHLRESSGEKNVSFGYIAKVCDKMLISAKFHLSLQVNWDHTPVLRTFHNSGNPPFVLAGKSACGVTATACARLLWIATWTKNGGHCIRLEGEPTGEMCRSVTLEL